MTTPSHPLSYRLVRSALGQLLRRLPVPMQTDLVAALASQHPEAVLKAISPRLDRPAYLDNMPHDLDPHDGESIQFQHLTGLFASTSLDHGVISMTMRDGAYLFGLARSLGVRTAIEIGRYKGGSTLIIAAAMQGQGDLWSIELGTKESRLRPGAIRPFDEQVQAALQRYGLHNVHLLVGDSRTLDMDTGEVDLVLVDGDHSYEGAKNDFERFGRRVRVGGAVLIDDVYDDMFVPTHIEAVTRMVREVLDEGSFRLVKRVNRMAHLERCR